MTSNQSQNFPVVSESQYIGQQATRAFIANHPNNWMCSDGSGDQDFGFDYQVQVQTNGLVKDAFRIQLKGTTSPKLSSDGQEFSFSLAMSTVNYYDRVTEPILLVLCDLSNHRGNAKNAPLYFVWIHDDLRRISQRGITDSQESVTFRIPVDNRLSETSDLAIDLERFRDVAKVGERLDISFQRSHPQLTPLQRSQMISKIPTNLSKKSPALMDAIVESPTTAWVEVPNGTFLWHVHEATEALRHGQSDSGQASLVAAHQLLSSANTLEQADYWHAVGLLRKNLIDDEGATEAFDQACSLTEDAAEHLLPWAEADLRARFQIDGPNDFSATIKRLEFSSDSPLIAMRARLMAAEGRFEDAIVVARAAQGTEKNGALAIIYTIQGKNLEAISECDAALNSTDIAESKKLFFTIMRARARFSIAANVHNSDQASIELPMTGPAGMPADQLHLIWQDVAFAIAKLQAIKWPSNVELIAEVWSATAAMLGLQRQTLPIMADAAAKRPTINELQTGVESLACQVGDFALALSANFRLSENDDVLLRRIALLHQSNKHRLCIDLMLEKENAVSHSHPWFGQALALAILSAEKIVRTDLVARWESLFVTLHSHAPYLALMRYFRKIANQPLARDMALAELEAEYIKLEMPRVIALHLFHEFDATNHAQAERCIAVAEKLTDHRLLDVRSSLHLAQALSTLKRWDELLMLSDSALKRFENSDRLISVGAIALDKLGRTSEAHRRLQQLVEKENPDLLALSTYIAIASRSGFATSAIACLEDLLAKEPRAEKKLLYLRHLFSLTQLSDQNSQRLLPLAVAIGSLSNQDDETQEGLYLVTMFNVILSKDVQLTDEQAEEFNGRKQTFINRFPNSKILRCVELPEDPTNGQFMGWINELTGATEDWRKARTALQTQLRNGDTSFPFVWRPRNVLDGVSDVPTLWELAKKSRHGDRQLHLTMAGGEWRQMPLHTLRAETPLLDLVSLLVIHDLGLVEQLFRFFGRIAIGKGTLNLLQELLTPMFGSQVRTNLVGLQNMLRSHFQDIDQPSVDIRDDSNSVGMPWADQENLQLIKSGDYTYYSDDLLLRQLADLPGEHQRPLCTLDFLCALDEAGLMSAKDVGVHIATLLNWRVGLSVLPRYQIAILPDELSSANNIAAAVSILHADPICAMMFDNIWDTRKPYETLQRDAVILLLPLLRNPANRIDTIAALAARWLSKSRLHKGAPGTPEYVIASLIIFIIAVDEKITSVTSSRIWSIYHALVEFNHGTKMDDGKYLESLYLAGQVAAQVDIRTQSEGRKSILERLTLGLTEGVSDTEHFTNAYTQNFIRLKQEIS